MSFAFALTRKRQLALLRLSPAKRVIWPNSISDEL